MVVDGSVGVEQRGGRKRARGSERGSSSRPCAIDPSFFNTLFICVFRLHVAEIDELPRGSPLERPLHAKRRRLWTPPSSDPVPLSTTGPSSSELDIVKEVEPEIVVANEVAPSCSSAFPPSLPALYVEVMADDVASTPHHHQSLQRRSFQRRRRPCDADIEAALNYGSENDSSCDEDEEGPPIMIPRALQQDLMDTPEDDVLDEVLPPSSNPSIASTAETMMPHDFFDFQWESFPNPPISPNVRREVFSVENVGPTIPVTDPYLTFREIWDEEIMGHIVQQTNIYAQQVAAAMMENNSLCPSSRISYWKDTNEDEILVYFAIILAMGVVVKSKLVDYWSTDGSIFVTPAFSTHMSLKRFQLLNACLHFSNNNDMCVESLSPSEAKMFKIAPIIEHCNKRFQALFVLNQNLALDESLLQWKGWLSINQFIPNKAAAVGIKTYELCDSETGYLWRFEVHAHKKATAAQPASILDASTPAIVLRLLQGLENHGYTVWMDNFYNSPALARSLKSNGFDVVGTLRTNRQFLPDELTQLTKAAMRLGQIAGFTSGDVDVLVWRDQNRVATISTYHGNATTIVEGKTKPIVVADYNIMMGGVDKKDGMLAMYPVERKRTRVWYKKFFRRLLNVSVLNSYIIYKKSPQQVTHRHDHRSFRTQLITSILDRHSKKQSVSLADQPAVRFEAHSHYLMEHPPMQGKWTKKLRRKCCICNTLTRFYCAGCNKTVCMHPCFPSLHTY
ncbi:hypothetical protein ABMA27_006026 [Loxostege sticticalis]|uniref:PiggyBac transposable element-derived protein domain-containing protein n=1 Tax=Loxostege sticticalis TaxID=481309 RepID=A0ABR3HHB9_LOXSC